MRLTASARGTLPRLCAGFDFNLFKLSALHSIRFNIGLIAALAALFALGTLIPQQTDAPEKVALLLNAHPAWARSFERLGLFHLYRAPLVIGLLALLAINITVCRLWTHLKNFKSGKGLRLSREKWGSLLNHIGLVVALAGALIKGIWGFEEFLMLQPGQDKPLRRFPTSTISLMDFNVEFYPDGKTPRQFESDLQATLKGQTKRQKIRVNEPLSLPALPLAPLRFYQAGWGATGMFKNAGLQIGSQKIPLKMDEPAPIPKTSFKVTAKKMFPDFTVELGRPATKTMEWNTPALCVIFKHAGFQSRPIWLLLNHPGAAFEELPDGTARTMGPPPFQVASIEPIFFSGIQAAYDPGFPVLIGGIFLTLAGLGLYLSAKWRTL